MCKLFIEGPGVPVDRVNRCDCSEYVTMCTCSESYRTSDNCSERDMPYASCITGFQKWIHGCITKETKTKHISAFGS